MGTTLTTSKPGISHKQLGHAPKVVETCPKSYATSATSEHIIMIIP